MTSAAHIRMCRGLGGAGFVNTISICVSTVTRSVNGSCRDGCSSSAPVRFVALRKGFQKVWSRR